MREAPKQLSRERGQVMLFMVIIFLLIFLAASLSIASITYREHVEVANLARSTQSLYAAEGLEEDVVYRLKWGDDISLSETLTLAGATASATITDLGSEKRVTSIGDAESRIRKSEVYLIEGSGASFFYGIQSGQGGFVMDGNASVVGNIYANGTIIGNGSTIEGDVVSAGPGGLISGVVTPYSAYAHRIEDSDITGDAHYTTIFNTQVGGTEYPGSSDQPEVPLPISDEQIEGWEAEAAAGTVITSPCPYSPANGEILGPTKIACDLNISSDVVIAGPVWAVGNISVSGSITVDSGMEGVSVPLIADNPANRSTGSRVDISGDASFVGSGENSYVLLVSQNNSSENGGSTTAVELRGNPDKDFLVYAAHGLIDISSNSSLREITAHTVSLSGNTQVEYESGISNLIFTTGPSGGYEIKSWGPVW